MLGLFDAGLDFWGDNMRNNDDYSYRFNGLGEPSTFWDNNGNYGDGSAPFKSCWDNDEESRW